MHMKPSDIPLSLVAPPGQPTAQHQTATPKENLWGTVAKAGATLVAILAAELSLIGHVMWATWLDHWGFDIGQMPLDATGRIIHGYLAVLNRGAALLSTWAGAFMGMLFVLLGLYISFVLTARTIAKKRGNKVSTVPKLLGRTPRWVKDILTGFGISAFCVAATYFLLVGTLLILVLGPTVGQGAAKSWAAATEARIKQGCKRPNEHGACTAVARDGIVLATGFILASSPTHVALYDVKAERTRMLKLDGTEMTGWLP